MKQPTWIAIAALALGACKVDLNKLARPGEAGKAAASSGEASVPGASQVEAAPQAPAVVQDICHDDERQTEARNTTLCEVLAIEPAAGVAKVGPRKPGWCRHVPADLIAEMLPLESRAPLEKLVTNKDLLWNTADAAGPLCTFPDDPAIQEQVGYLYQYWLNVAGLTPEQIDPFIESIARRPGMYDRHTAMAAFCAKYPKPDDSLPERDRLFANARRAVVGCAHGEHYPNWYENGYPHDMSWYTDLDTGFPSEVLRAYAVDQCLPARDDLSDTNLASYAICGFDARALDVKALESEIASWDPLSKVHARLQHWKARTVAKHYEAAARAKAAASPWWQTILFDAPAKGWDAWVAMYTANKDAIDRARAYELEGGDRCWKQAWGDYHAHVTAAGAKTRDEIERAMTDEGSAILLGHVVACADAMGDEAASRWWGSVLGASPLMRGPRQAAYQAMRRAFDELEQPDGLDVSTSHLNSFAARGKYAGGGGSGFGSTFAGHTGVVEKMKEEDGGYRIVFKMNRWKQTTWDCQPNGKVKFYQGDGTPVYHQDCKDLGEEWYEGKHEDVWIRKEHAVAIKKGVYLMTHAGMDTHDGANEAIPVLVWTDTEQKKLLACMGIALTAR